MKLNQPSTIFVDLVKIHKGIYRRLILKVGAEYLKGLQKGPTIRMWLLWCHIHESEHMPLKARKRKLNIEFFEKSTRRPR